MPWFDPLNKEPDLPSLTAANERCPAIVETHRRTKNPM
jgi:hypothetical protein